MIVSDIVDEAVEITGRQVGPMLFKKLTRVIEALSNKGNWDSQQLYMDISVQEGEPIVILPREVLAPIKININKNPTFSRNRLYEFSLMGPGTQDDGLTGWQWADMNTVPLLADLPSIGSVLKVQGDASDNGKKIHFYGLDAQGNEVDEEVVLDGTLQTTTKSFQIMRRVRKDVTTKRVAVSLPNGDLVANYYGDEVEPQYRKIKLSKKASSIHMFFRRANTAITTVDDYIPLNSQSAVLYMLKAQELAEQSQSGPSQESENWEKLALQRLQEDQAARNAFAALADSDEVQPGLNLNINNRDSVIAADVIDDVFSIFGPIGLHTAFDRITDAIEILNNKAYFADLCEGYVDLYVGRGGIVTLPRYVMRPVKILKGCRPLQMHNRWFEFHMDGPGSTANEPCGFWSDLGEAVTVNDPLTPFRLVAVNDVDADDGKEIRVYGYDDKGNRVRTPNDDPDGPEYIDGAVIVSNYSNTLPADETPVFSRIERITREETNGFQKLIAYPTDNVSPILIGYYYPDETEPRYSRIRVPVDSGWVRMRYRKRGLKITALTDPLNLKSRMAVVDMLRALKAKKDNPQVAEAYETKAVQYLLEEQATNNPAQQFVFEVDPTVDASDPRTRGMSF